MLRFRPISIKESSLLELDNNYCFLYSKTMWHRKLFCFISFFFVLLVNFYFIVRLYQNSRKQANVEKILSEISNANNPQNQFRFSAAPFVLGAYTTDISLVDGRAANLKSFFRKYNSPLYDSAETIVRVSDQYQFDYRLLPAISMQESNLCKYIPDNSYNCWGWGIYGDVVTRFSSYDEAIETVAKGIKQEYIDKGLLTASAIMEKYTPSSKGSWAHGVNTFLKALE